MFASSLAVTKILSFPYKRNMKGIEENKGSVNTHHETQYPLLNI
jgi:hypothetical protein